MHIASHRLSIQTQGNNQCIDITQNVQRILDEEKIWHGQATVFVPGSTAGVTTIEYESGVVQDLKTALERMFPSDGIYEHHSTAGDNNGAAHQRAAFIGPSLVVPVVDGRLALGTWQQLVIVDCDLRPRKRSVIIQVVGVRTT